MHSQIINRNVVEFSTLPSPADIRKDIPTTDNAENHVRQSRKAIKDILDGKDQRLIAIIGPCSIHDLKAAHEYADKVATWQKNYADDLLIVMRTYFEKPRTTVGWKGLISDPHLDGSENMELGIRTARTLLRDLCDRNIACATEFLGPIVPQYIAEFISWSAIGARTTESQTHREMASGLSMPVGFKNGTDGSIDIALNAMQSCSSSHSFCGVDDDGRIAIVRSAGNKYGHLVLRGGNNGPNYDQKSIASACQQAEKHGVRQSMVIDCSHGNSNKQPERQPEVCRDIANSIREGQSGIAGIMLESHLCAGNQKYSDNLTYGQSLTDACINLDDTERCLETLASAVSERSSAAI